jgi:hypothetical protein
LKRVFRNPLHLYISSGRRCRCHLLQKPKDICKTPWEKLYFLPFERFSELVVSFAPDLSQVRCSKERQELKKTRPRGTDLTAREFSAAMSCVIRQSFCIGSILEGIQENPRNRSKVSKIRFVCDDSGIQPLDADRRTPLWLLNRIDAMLNPWRWASTISDLTPQVQYPKRLALFFKISLAWETFSLQYDSPHLPQRAAQTAEAGFSAWIMRRGFMPPAPAARWSDLVINNSMPWVANETLCEDLNMHWNLWSQFQRWERCDILCISVEEACVDGGQSFRWRGDKIIPLP